MTIKKISIFVAFSSFSAFLNAQSISGKILDKDEHPVSFSEIVLTKDKKNFSGIADNSGAYSIKLKESGDYSLSVLQNGIKVFDKIISINNENLIENIKINLGEKEIEEVVLKGKGKIFERKIDRFVYNIENSAVSQGLNIGEALSNVPLIRTDNGGISIVGKSGISLMVNDRPINLSGGELMNYLKSIQTDNVSKVEIITTPPAKYDAQGNSGMINIIMKKNPNMGFSGSVSSNLIQRTWLGTSNNLNLNYQNERFNTSLRLRHYDVLSKSYENYEVDGINSLLSRDDRRDNDKALGANLSIDYQINKNSYVGFIYDFGNTKSNMDINNTSLYRSNNITTRNLATYSEHRNYAPSHTLNLYYDLFFGKDKKKKFYLKYNYFANSPYTELNFDAEDITTNSNEIVRNLTDINYKIWSGQYDFSLPYKWIKVEFGSKFTNFDNNSDIQYYDLLNSAYILDSSKSNIFDYNEKNIANYISFDKKINDKWSAKMGLRHEYSIIKGYTPATGETNENKYGKWFPSAYIMYIPNDNNSFSLNYSKRINRPSFRSLNPFKWYSNPYSYGSGNPQLQPSFNDNIEFSYTYKNSLYVSVYYQYMKNAYDQLSFIRDQIFVTSYENFYNQQNFGINASYSKKIFKWWDAYLSLNSSFNNADVYITNAEGQKGTSFYYNTNHTFTLNKDKTLSMTVSYWQNLPSRNRNALNRSQASFTTNFKYYLMNRNLQLTLTFIDIFKQQLNKGEVYFSDNTQFYNNYYDSRRINFGVTYNFGNNKVRGNNKRINFDEKNRADK